MTKMRGIEHDWPKALAVIMNCLLLVMMVALIYRELNVLDELQFVLFFAIGIVAPASGLIMLFWGRERSQNRDLFRAIAVILNATLLAVIVVMVLRSNGTWDFESSLMFIIGTGAPALALFNMLSDPAPN
jgi:uncharacterized membrane protein YwaF